MQTQSKPLLHQCHICEQRGGCLGMLLLDNPTVSEHLQQSKLLIHKGEHIFRESEENDAFYIVRSGTIKSYLTTEQGTEHVFGFYMAGDIFGLDSSTGNKHATSAVSLETTSLCRFPYGFLKSRTKGAKLLDIIAEQLRRDRNLAMILARKDSDSRVAAFLTDLGDRHQKCGYSATTFRLTMSRQDVGNHLGLAVETISRTFTRFQASDILRVNRREIVILDRKELCKIAGLPVVDKPVVSKVTRLKVVK